MKKLHIWNRLPDGRHLSDYLLDSQREYAEHKLKNPNYSIPWEEEELIWALQSWYDMMGQFTVSEYRMLYETYSLVPNEVDDIVKAED